MTLFLCLGLQADFLAKSAEHENKSNNDKALSYWPPYASTLVFELVQIDETEVIESNPLRQYVVRVLLNGQPIVCHNGTILLGGGPDGMLFLDDFDDMVQQLEVNGGEEFQAAFYGSGSFDERP
jgi:hypothetical protein